MIRGHADPLGTPCTRGHACVPNPWKPFAQGVMLTPWEPLARITLHFTC